jgi:Ca-activated chloride channel family protein
VSILTILNISADSLLKFIDISRAKKAYEDQNYTKAVKHYRSIDGDEARYNLANSYYKSHDYRSAIELYNSISDKSLEFKKLHNLGNAYALNKEIDKAIDAYNKALKIKDDSDTRFNLELLKNRKKEKQEKNKNQQGDSSNTSQNKESSGKDSSSEDKSSNSRSKERQNSKQKDSQDSINKSAGEQVEKKEDSDLSDLQERKYMKMLDSRGVKTLLLPLDRQNKGDSSEQKPW